MPVGRRISHHRGLPRSIRTILQQEDSDQCYPTDRILPLPVMGLGLATIRMIRTQVNMKWPKDCNPATETSNKLQHIYALYVKKMHIIGNAANKSLH